MILTFTCFLWRGIVSLPTIVTLGKVQTSEPRLVPYMEIPFINVNKHLFKSIKWGCGRKLHVLLGCGCSYHTESFMSSKGSPSSSQWLSIVMLLSVSCAESKFVTDRVGIPRQRHTAEYQIKKNNFISLLVISWFWIALRFFLYVLVVRRPENTQHCPYRTGLLPLVWYSLMIGTLPVHFQGTVQSLGYSFVHLPAKTPLLSQELH